METVATLPRSELPQMLVTPDLSHLREKAKTVQEKATERWYALQVFLGKSAVRQALAMEGAGTIVDLTLMGAGLTDPLTREPVAMMGDVAVLHHLNAEHGGAEQDTPRSKKIKDLGKAVVLMGVAIGAQKAGLHVTEHMGIAQDQYGEMGTQIVSKVGAITATNAAIGHQRGK